jgi:hypothetical protein
VRLDHLLSKEPREQVRLLHALRFRADRARSKQAPECGTLTIKSGRFVPVSTTCASRSGTSGAGRADLGTLLGPEVSVVVTELHADRDRRRRAERLELPPVC